MSTEMVQVGCRLPNGYTLEVGFTVNDEGKGGAPFAMYRKSREYKAVTLKGLNQRSIIRGLDNKPIAMSPAQIGREPFINTIPKDFWECWKKNNAEQWVLTSGQVFEIPKGNDATTVKAVSLDAKAKSPNVFEPINQDMVMKLEDHSVSKRTDD